MLCIYYLLTTVYEQGISPNVNEEPEADRLSNSQPDCPLESPGVRVGGGNFEKLSVLAHTPRVSDMAGDTFVSDPETLLCSRGSAPGISQSSCDYYDFQMSIHNAPPSTYSGNNSPFWPEPPR